MKTASSRSRRILVAGGAGFLGSHLVDRLVKRGAHVWVADNLLTGSIENIAHHLNAGRASCRPRPRKSMATRWCTRSPNHIGAM